MTLCDLRGKLLFEVSPSLFSEGELGETEMLLWELYYREKKERAEHNG